MYKFSMENWKILTNSWKEWERNFPRHDTTRVEHTRPQFHFVVTRALSNYGWRAPAENPISFSPSPW